MATTGDLSHMLKKKNAFICSLYTREADTTICALAEHFYSEDRPATQVEYDLVRKLLLHGVLCSPTGETKSCPERQMLTAGLLLRRGRRLKTLGERAGLTGVRL